MTDPHYAEAAPNAARAGSQGGSKSSSKGGAQVGSSPGSDSVRPLPNGHRLAGFELDSVLGTGGFGIVYRAFDRTLQRAVAVKEYMPAMLASREGDFTVALRAARFSQAFDAGRAAFLNEARLLAQFDHPGLVKVLHFWESHGTAYMVMPYYEGQTLEQLHQRGQRLSEPALLRLLAAVLGALDVLHRAQCFHRDISLDNILILPNGNPVLLDFGAARKLIGDMVDETAMMLKPGYAPIEQYTDDPAFQQGPWTDIYALGAVAYALMTGELPPAAVVRSIQDQYRPLAGRAAANGDEQRNGQEHYSERVRAAIDHALALRIEDRPESVAAFAQALGLHEPTPGVFVPAGYEAMPRAAAPDLPAPAAEKPAGAVANAQAEAKAKAKAVEPRDSVEVPAPAPDASPREVEPETPPPQSADNVAATADAQPHDSASESLAPRFARRSMRIPALVLLLVLAVGILALRYAIHTPENSTQTAANPSAPAVPAAPASHPATLALAAPAAPAANPPAQPQVQAQPGTAASALATPGSSTPPAAPALTTDTTVVEVQAGKDKPANATDNTADDPTNSSTDQSTASAQTAQAADATQAAPSGPQVAHTPTRTAIAPNVRTPAPMRPVRVHFQVLPWGEVYVDGVRRGVSPPFHTASLSPGTHRIEIRNGSLQPYVRTVTLDVGSPPLEISYKFE
ncbi:protein kinase [Paraburkholderia sacchari]|uniref:non-specific serine/threonine protein kinase n=1 Tax=Paraburkholderia sacchari TaxID=159450 RepID=A0A8T6ZE76_9BURK|nr:serine/threonine-protein kinase [Paraburkholderia sacchari]NLP62985.1 protein kinase [Paraburkholderia sacchari]